MDNTEKKITAGTEKAGVSEEMFVVRAYQEGDEYHINAMFNEVFSQSRDMSHWYWKYRDNPYGSFCISVAVGPEGVFASHFAAYPLKLCFLGEAERGHCVEQIIYHAGDKMTRRRFRRVGLGKSALLARTFMHFRETFAPAALFTYGFMTHHSLRFGLLLLGYTVIEEVPYRTLALDKFPRVNDGFLRKFVRGITAEAVSDIDETWTEFFLRAARHYKTLIRRDAAYLRWRYLKRPDKKYFIVATRRRSRLAGWSVFYREANKLIWGDALFEKGDVDSVRAALSFVCSHPFSAGTDVVEGWFPQRPEWWNSTLNRLGFTTEKEPNCLRFCIGNYVDDDTPGMIRDHFYYTMGDSDLF
jgi:hypothetical protein